jgi:hypothetical protein
MTVDADFLPELETGIKEQAEYDSRNCMPLGSYSA